MNYDTGLYSTGCKEKIAVDEAIFWRPYKNQEFFYWKYPLLSLPFLSHLSLLKRNSENVYSQNFQTRLVQYFIFSSL